MGMIVDLDTRPALTRTLVRTASLGAVTAEALTALERISLSCAQGRLRAAERSGAMRAWRPLCRRPALYTLTAEGQRALGLPGARPVKVSASRAGHMIACCEVAAALELLYPERRVAGEAELLRSGSPLACVQVTGRNAPARHRADLALLPRLGSRSAGWGAVEDRGALSGASLEPAARRWALPDPAACRGASPDHATCRGASPDHATCRGASPDHATHGGAPPDPVARRAASPSRSIGALAVEVELTVKEPRRLLAICTAWARCRELDGVLYVVPPAVRPALERAVAGARAQRWIATADLSELVSLIREPHPKRRVAWDHRAQISTMETENA